MAIASLLTLLEDYEGTPTFVGYSGGQAASVNDDVIIEAAQSGGRRVDNTTGKGFGVTIPSEDLSAAGQHVKMWVSVTQWAEVTQVQLRISSGADDDHVLPAAEYPPLFGFIPLWCDVSRAPESGGSANEAAIVEVGILLDIGDVGGNAPNLIEDALHSGTSGLRWTGTGGDIQDFRDYEDTNNEGNLVTLNGVDFLYSRMEFGVPGGASASDATDSGFKVICPDQSLVADTFMGWTVYLENASDDWTFSNASLESADVENAGKRPDLLVIGTDGALALNSFNGLGLRLLQMTAGCTFTGGIWDVVDFTQDGGELQNATLRARTAAGVAVCDDPTFGTTSGLHDLTVEQAGLGHAFELTVVEDITLTNINFDSAFGGTPGDNLVANSGPNDAMIYNNTGDAVEITVAGGSTPSIRNGAGATTTVVAGFTLTITNVPNGGILQILDNDDAPADHQDMGTVLQTTNPTTGADVTFGHDKGGDDIFIQYIDDNFEEVNVPFDLLGQNQTFDLSTVLEPEVNI